MFPTSSYLPQSLNIVNPIFELQNITDTEIAKIISTLKKSKASDVNGIDTNFLRTHAEALVQPITLLVNQSINQKTVPSVWKEAVITPVFKSGSKTQISNYRPISILPAISKVTEKWIVNQLIEHLDQGPTSLHRMQFGFRKNHSTETSNCFFVEKKKFMLSKKNTYVGAVFLN